ncbi:TRAP transporter small permease [Hippea maritima]|uniref:Tripartite ATP-independent periplasmic transporter DctQ component n=1 Tax=Hippea maritima (strain ATCC 700847 / DSM 10411 / MH2) TaxID=760142 RepID=F2LX71_HIPMA|nr:TRAP transporter small permease [Hippea maritima]AEA33129.1 Tripartite ATP-independent periplasmic transporter DctQ component [Hippea maritima DSM 10411]
MKRIVKISNLLSNTINKLIEVLVVLLALILSFFMVLSVFYRYILNNSIYYSSELCRFLLVYITFLGSTVAYKHKAHIGVDVFVEYLPLKGKRFIELLIELSFLSFMVLLFVVSLKFLPMMWLQRTATLQLPYAYIFLIVPVSSAIFSIHIINRLVEIISQWSG